jgi:hypothetical protein
MRPCAVPAPSHRAQPTARGPRSGPRRSPRAGRSSSSSPSTWRTSIRCFRVAIFPRTISRHPPDSRQPWPAAAGYGPPLRQTPGGAATRALVALRAHRARFEDATGRSDPGRSRNRPALTEERGLRAHSLGQMARIDREGSGDRKNRAGGSDSGPASSHASPG